MPSKLWPGRAIAAAGAAGLAAAMLTVLPGPVSAASGPAPAAAAPNQILYGVAATSARNAWAVGIQYSGSASQTLIEHWNGRSWRPVASPGLHGSISDSFLDSVATSATGNAWAVGASIRTGPTRNQGIILHWNGRSWRQVPAPNPGGLSGGELLGVAAVPDSRVFWAVGDYTDPVRHRDRTLIERWNGRSWRQIPSPTPAFPAHDLALFGVTATSARSARAVGSYAGSAAAKVLRERWNGRSWRIQP